MTPTVPSVTCFFAAEGPPLADLIAGSFRLFLQRTWPPELPNEEAR